MSSCSISTIASSDVLHRIETPVLLELHDKVNIAALLTNSESWTLLKCELKKIEIAEIQCLKHLFDLPVRTPTVAIIFTLGTLITSIRVDQKRLIYLHKILSRDPLHWKSTISDGTKELSKICQTTTFLRITRKSEDSDQMNGKTMSEEPSKIRINYAS